MLDSLKMKVLKYSPDDGNGEGEDEKVTFKNQEALNDVVEKRLAKQKKKLLDEQEQKFKDMKETFEDQLAAIKDDLKEAKKVKSSSNDDDNPKLGELSKTVETLNKEIKKVTKEKEDAVKKVDLIKTTNKYKSIQSTIVSLLSEAKVVAPNDIYIILKNSGGIALDEDENVIPVYANTDNQVHGSNGDPMDIKTYIDGWLKERPHFVSASGKTGSGTKSVDTSIKTDTKTDGENEETPSLTDILKSKEHLEKENELRETSVLQHGGENFDKEK